MESSQEERFNTFDLGISWYEFGDLRESDLDAILGATDLTPVQKGKVVSLWKRHPNRQTGKIYLILIIVPHFKCCIIYLLFCKYQHLVLLNSNHDFTYVIYVYSTTGNDNTKYVTSIIYYFEP